VWLTARRPRAKWQPALNRERASQRPTTVLWRLPSARKSTRRRWRRRLPRTWNGTRNASCWSRSRATLRRSFWPPCIATSSASTSFSAPSAYRSPVSMYTRDLETNGTSVMWQLTAVMFHANLSPERGLSGKGKPVYRYFISDHPHSSAYCCYAIISHSFRVTINY